VPAPTSCRRSTPPRRVRTRRRQAPASSHACSSSQRPALAWRKRCRVTSGGGGGAAVDVRLLGLRLCVDTGLAPLLRRDGRRRLRERVVAATGLREGDDLADRLGAREERDDPVPAEGDAAVRRGAVGERVEQEAELLPRLLLADAHDGEDPLLDVPAVDTDGSAADLVAVAHDVVGVCERVARVLLEAVDPLGGRGGEGVVDGGPRAGADGDVVVLAGGLEERRVDDPDEGPGVLVDEPGAPADLEAGGAEQGAGLVLPT